MGSCISCYQNKLPTCICCNKTIHIFQQHTHCLSCQQPIHQRCMNLLDTKRSYVSHECNICMVKKQLYYGSVSVSSKSDKKPSI